MGRKLAAIHESSWLAVIFLWPPNVSSVPDDFQHACLFVYLLIHASVLLPSNTSIHVLYFRLCVYTSRERFTPAVGTMKANSISMQDRDCTISCAQRARISETANGSRRREVCRAACVPSSL